MSAPKHLWSGDWQQESAAVSEDLAGRRADPRALAGAAPTAPAPHAPAPPAPAPPPAPPPIRPRPGPDRPRPAPDHPRPAARRRRARRSLRLSPRFRQLLPLALALALILGAGAYGVTRVLDSSGSPASATVSQPSGPIHWLGMQIASVTPGTVVIQTVASGSSAERAGLEPGDVIDAVNGQPITAPGQIAGAISSLRPGAYVPVEVNRGSTQVTTQAELAGPPSNHP